MIQFKVLDEYMLICKIDTIRVYAAPDYRYWVHDWKSDGVCYLRFVGAGFIWSEQFLNLEWQKMIETKILAHELIGLA